MSERVQERLYSAPHDDGQGFCTFLHHSFPARDSLSKAGCLKGTLHRKIHGQQAAPQMGVRIIGVMKQLSKGGV